MGSIYDVEDANSNYDLRVLSLGAGIQSSALALMMEKGEVRKPDCAIFSDTQSEPKAVYEYLEYLKTQVSFPIHVVTEGSLEQDSVQGLKQGKRFASIPFHVINLEGEKGMLRRQCTNEYKIQPIYRQVRKLLGLEKGQRSKYKVALYMGISLDEVTRVRVNPTKWIDNVYPLIGLRLTRTHCKEWLTENEYKMPVRSACYFCPYISNVRWKEIRDTDPESFQKAIEFDEMIRGHNSDYIKIKSEMFIHSSCTPLKDIDFDEDDGQLDMFLGECEGMCGI